MIVSLSPLDGPLSHQEKKIIRTRILQVAKTYKRHLKLKQSPQIKKKIENSTGSMVIEIDLIQSLFNLSGKSKA